jgi:hypothetical protein
MKTGFPDVSLTDIEGRATNTRFSEIMEATRTRNYDFSWIFRACNESTTRFLRELSVGLAAGHCRTGCNIRLDTRAGFHVSRTDDRRSVGGQKSVSCPLPGSVFARNNASSS